MMIFIFVPIFFVERESQKGIVIGAKGSLLKKDRRAGPEGY